MKPYIILALLLSIGRASLAQDAYSNEAEAFRNSIAPGWQISQAQAIKEAISGDHSKLEKIRHSRNPQLVLPDGIDTCHINNYRLYTPSVKNDNHLPLLIYFHGGGWTIGSINSCADFCCGIVAKGDIAVLAVDYPLAPEHPFPAALNDCAKALDYAIAHATDLGIDPNRISVGGDSAGGNLAFTLSLQRIIKQQTLPHSIIAFYPVVAAWNDQSQSWLGYGAGYGLDACYMEAFNEAYTDDHHNMLVSPQEAPDTLLRQMPKTLMVAAQRDILCDQGHRFAEKLAKLGVDIERVEIPGAVHLFITVNGQPSARTRAIDLTHHFMCGQPIIPSNKFSQNFKNVAQ